MKLADQILENKIQLAYLALVMATSKDDMRKAHDQMAELIAMRSAEYIKEMEQRKGLRQ